MKLSVSNIAWSAEHDNIMFNFLYENNIEGLEIAPTRIIPENPYAYKDIAAEFSQNIKSSFNLSLSSMQSIWYGITMNMFENVEDTKFLLDYTKKAIDFAKAINCKNIVFGCPKNRNISNQNNIKKAYSFFSEIADYALKNNTCIAIEPNPEIYGTNFINSTKDAFDFCKKINSKGFKVNVDFGTIIHNNESLKIIPDNINLVNHIHISEPYLEKIKERKLHLELIKIIKKSYNNYISIEMKNTNNLSDIKNAVLYLKEVCS